MRSFRLAASTAFGIGVMASTTMYFARCPGLSRPAAADSHVRRARDDREKSAGVSRLAPPWLESRDRQRPGKRILDAPLSGHALLRRRWRRSTASLLLCGRCFRLSEPNGHVRSRHARSAGMRRTGGGVSGGGSLRCARTNWRRRDAGRRIARRSLGRHRSSAAQGPHRLRRLCARFSWEAAVDQFLAVLAPLPASRPNADTMACLSTMPRAPAPPTAP